MTIDIDRYCYRVTWSEEDEEYVGTCLEFPSLSWLDESPGNALSGIRSVVSDCIEDMTETNEDIPPPLSTKKFSGKFMVRVSPHLHRQLTIQAAETGMSLNRFITSKLSS
ncbi:MAG: toxin-antitoxin system HicB family antitoxin [Cyanobacteria bacterium P01_E01_bin.34]